MPSIDLEQRHINEILKILKRFFGENSKFYIFGSRAKGTARKYSDIDIAVDYNGQLIEFDLKSRASVFFSENTLIPYDVDLVDLNSISPEFRKHIDKDLVRLN